MNDVNPYQSPEFKPELNKLHRLAAKQLLSVHEQGPGFWVFFHLNAPWLLIRYISSIPIVAIICIFGDRRAMYPAIGLLVGFFYFDLMFVRIQRKIWPVYEETLDWAKVKKLVEGE